MNRLFASLFLFCAILFFLPRTAFADTFGTGLNTFDIEFVTIGDPGNVADTSGTPNPAGSVPYKYRIGKYEISEQMIEKANTLGGLGITKDARGANKPATSVSWNEVARFVNWLNVSSGNAPAYKFAIQPGEPGYNIFQSVLLWTPSDPGYDANNLYRNSKAKYFLPSVDEWYKAAFYDPNSGVYYNYATGSDTPPTPVASGTAASTAVYNQPALQGPADITLAGGLSPYGTMGQDGNVWELEETDYDLVNGPSSDSRGIRGGNWFGDSSFLIATFRGGVGSDESATSRGFRVASRIIPEPSSLLFLGIGLAGALVARRRPTAS